MVLAAVVIGDPKREILLELLFDHTALGGGELDSDLTENEKLIFLTEFDHEIYYFHMIFLDILTYFFIY